MHALKQSRGKHVVAIICTGCAEWSCQIQRYNNSPPCMTFKMAAMPIAWHSAKRDLIPFFRFLGHYTWIIVNTRAVCVTIWIHLSTLCFILLTLKCIRHIYHSLLCIMGNGPFSKKQLQSKICRNAIPYTRAFQPAALGQHAAREATLCGPWSHIL